MSTNETYAFPVHDLSAWRALAEKDWRFLIDYVNAIFRGDWGYDSFATACEIFRAIPESEKVDAYSFFVRSLVAYYDDGGQLNKMWNPFASKVHKFPREIRLLLTCAYSGYMREAALQDLKRATDPAEMVFAIGRLNDWVPQIRARAYQIVEPWLARLTPEQVSALLPAILRLEKGRRHSAELLVVRAIARVTGDEQATLNFIMTGAHALARRVYAAAWSNGDVNKQLLLQAAQKSKDSAMRRMALRLVYEAFDELQKTGPGHDVVQHAFDGFTGDADPKVRVLHLRLAKRLGGEEWARTFSEGLFDSNRSVRALAQFEHRGLVGYVAGALGSEDKREAANESLRATYQRELARDDVSSRRLAAAICGAAEVGLELSVDELESYLGHENNPVRLAALEHQNVPDRLLWQCFEAESGCSPKVCRAATKRLRNSGAAYSVEDILEVFAMGQQSETRCALIGLVAALPYWERLYGCLAIWPMLPQEWKYQVQSIVSGWVARTDIGAKPAAALFEKIKKQIEQLEATEDEALKLDDIKWAIKGWRLE